MNDPKRLLCDGADSFERHLLESANVDSPSRKAFARAMTAFGGAAGAAGIAAASSGSAGAASIAGSSSGAGAMATGSASSGAAAAKLAIGTFAFKWGAIGAVCAATATTLTGSVLRPALESSPSDVSPKAWVRRSQPAPEAPATTGFRIVAPAPAPEASATTGFRIVAPAPSAASSPSEGHLPKEALESIDTSTPRAIEQPRNAAPYPHDSAKGRGALTESHSDALSRSSNQARLDPSISKPSTLLREVALLDKARAALSDGDPAAALAFLERRDREFGAGSLQPESVVLRVEALLRQGNRAAAEQAAAPSLAVHGRGPLADRLRALFGAQNP